jgi:methylthioribose-1-phosphate isomerase
VLSVFGGPQIAPKGADVLNPAFDVTPAGLIQGIITERGIFKPEDIAEQFRR